MFYFVFFFYCLTDLRYLSLILDHNNFKIKCLFVFLYPNEKSYYFHLLIFSSLFEFNIGVNYIFHLNLLFKIQFFIEMIYSNLIFPLKLKDQHYKVYISFLIFLLKHFDVYLVYLKTTKRSLIFILIPKANSYNGNNLFFNFYQLIQMMASLIFLGKIMKIVIDLSQLRDYLYNRNFQSNFLLNYLEVSRNNYFSLLFYSAFHLKCE